jgi:hypothetical protein
VFGTFLGCDVLRLGTFCIWDVLGLGCFVAGMFCLVRFAFGAFLGLGRFVLERFVCAPNESLFGIQSFVIYL